MIGWYVHHHGRGHLTRAAAVRPYVDESVTVLSSLPGPRNHPFETWVHLDRDDEGPGVTADADAHGRLHWAPLGSAGLSRRMAALAGWIASYRPRLMVVDVSVEVALLARLCGVPVVVVAGPGERPDPAHRLGFDIAETLIAAWPRDIYCPDHLRSHLAKTEFVGAFSRFDHHARPPSPDTGQVFVLNGAGGTSVTPTDLEQARAATPHYRWVVAGGPGQTWSDDVWASLQAASVVVTHAGQNALAEVAAARRPAIVVAQERPFDEQRCVAEALADHKLAIARPSWPDPTEWPDLLAAARALGGDGWADWNDNAGAARAGAVINAAGRM